MRNTVSSLSLAFLAVSIFSGSALAQASASGSDRAKAYAIIAQLPAFEGVWQADRGSVTALRGAEGKAPLTSKARALVDAFEAAKERGENLQHEGANCMPVGMPGVMRYPYPIEILYSPGKVNIVIETHSQIRSIHTDGRSLPEDPDLLFNGSSVGHWDGRTLVVDTSGLSPQISLISGLHPTENTRIRERIYLDDHDKLAIETTITDPELFTEPFITSMLYKLEPTWEIREYICQENNRDAADTEGRPSMDLGLDNSN